MTFFVSKTPEAYYAPERTDRLVLAMFPDKPRRAKSVASFIFTVILLIALITLAHWAFTECCLPFRGCPDVLQTSTSDNPVQSQTVSKIVWI